MAVPMCPGCRALLDPGTSPCPYCGWNLEVTGIRRSGGLVERALRPLGGAVTVLIYANVLAAVAAAFVEVRGSGEGGGIDLWINAVLGPDALVLRVLGADVPARVWKEGQVWRMLAATFLHGGLLHIFFNLSALRNIGPAVEQACGSGKTLALYLLAGIAGSAGTVAWAVHRSAANPGAMEITAIGASGAILGLAGILVGFGLRIGGPAGKALWMPLVKSVGLILLLGVILAFSRSPIQIDNAAHAGGLLFGLGAGFLCSFGARARANPRTVLAWDVAAIVLAALTVASFVPPAITLARVMR